MKKLTWIAFLPLALMACNNDSKDSVEKADSANAAKMDTASVNNKMDTSGMSHGTIAVDEKTSSFMVKAANGGMAEVQLGQLAQQKATMQNVKDFGGMMVTDHGAVNEQMKALAVARNVTLPSMVSNDKQKEMDDLSKKTGKDFDKAYVKMMVKGHEETLDLFKKASGDVKDTEVKALIDNTIPKIQMHLDNIKAIEKGMK